MIEVKYHGQHLHLSWDQWETRVRQGRIQPDASVRFPPITGDLFVPAHELEIFNSLFNQRALRWSQAVAEAGPPVLTALLVGAQLRVWWLSKVPGGTAMLQNHFAKWTPLILEDAEVHRLLTMGVLHTSLDHLIMNMLWLGYTGLHLERALGWRNLLWLFGASVLGGSVASTFLNPAFPSLGASGGIFGLVAASVIFGLTRPELIPERTRGFFGFFLLPYLVLMLISGFQSPLTDNWAHLGGMITGIVLAFLVDPPQMQRHRGWNTRLHLTSLVIAALLMGGLAWFGPAVQPLWDARRIERVQARRQSQPLPTLPAPSDRELFHRAPPGYRPAVHVSPAEVFLSPDGRTSWQVTSRRTPSPRTTDELFAAWRDEAGRKGWILSDISSQPTELPNAAYAVHYRAMARRDQQERIVHVHIGVRGIHALLAEYIHPPSREAHLRPTHERLLASISWNVEDALLGLQEAVFLDASSFEQRRRLAAAYSEHGDVAEATRMYERLLDEVPDDWASHKGLLKHWSWYPLSADAPDRLLEGALQANASPQSISLMADFLDQAGLHDRAEALLWAAWIDEPGHTALRRALHQRGHRLQGTNARWPILLAYSPSQDAFTSPEERLTLLQTDDLVIRSARLEDRLQTERAWLQERFDTLDPAWQLRSLMWLSELGGWTDPRAAHQQLVTDLTGLLRGEELDWWLPGLPGAGRLLSIVERQGPLPQDLLGPSGP